MNTTMNNLKVQAERYAKQHGLVLPSSALTREQAAVAISQACEHAIAHPRNKYARALMSADSAFSKSIS